MGKQPPATEPGLIPLHGHYYIDYGNGVFTTTGGTATVRTRLNTIEYGMAQSYDTYSWLTDAFQDDMLCVEHAVSSGAVTITRGTSGTSALKFNYFFIGTLNATD